MKKLVFHPTAILFICCLVLSSCSGSKSQDQAKEGRKTSTGQAVDAIKEYSARPINKARAVQQLGEERTNAIDDAVRQK
jgi:uncharacterized protein YceK